MEAGQERQTWLIIDLETNRPFYGAHGKTMLFSSEEIAIEIAVQLFTKRKEFLIIQIPDIKL